MSHLRSTAHMEDTRVQCPACLRYFVSTSALTQHAESQATRCRVRDTDEYRIFIDQLTGGLADVQGRHTDDTVRYTVPEEAAAAFGGGMSSEERQSQLQMNAQRAARAAMDHAAKKRENYWKDHQPSW